MARTYSYVVLVEKRPICRGKNLKKMLKEVRRKYPKKTISIRYEYPKEILLKPLSKIKIGKVVGKKIYKTIIGELDQLRKGSLDAFKHKTFAKISTKRFEDMTKEVFG